MSASFNSPARYVIRTRNGDRGPFSREQIRHLVESGRLPLDLRILDTETRQGVLVSALMASGPEPTAPLVADSADSIPAARPEDLPAAAESDRNSVAHQSAHRSSTSSSSRSRQGHQHSLWAIMARIGSWPRGLALGACNLGILILACVVGRQVIVHARSPLHPAAASPPPLQRHAIAIDAAELGFERSVKPFLAANCLACHGPDKQKGDVRFDQATFDPSDGAAAALWKRAAQQLADGTMPPSSRPRPEHSQQARVVAWMHDQIQRNRQIWPVPALRRLTRAEYANAVVDLLGTQDDLRSLMPEEQNGQEGFPNEAEQLQITAHSVEAYLKAAKLAAAHAIQPVPLQHWDLRIQDADPTTCDPGHLVHWEHIPRLLNSPSTRFNAVARGDTLVFNDPYPNPNVGSGVIFSYVPITIPQTGLYRIRLRACALNHGRSPVRVRITFTDVGDMNFWEQGTAVTFRHFVDGSVTGTFADEAAVEAAFAAIPAELPLTRLKEIDPVLGAMYETAASKICESGIGTSQIATWLKNTKPVPKTVMDQAQQRAEWLECVGRLPAGTIKLTIDAEDMRDRWLFVEGDVAMEGPLPCTYPQGSPAPSVAHEQVDEYVSWLAGIMSKAYRRPVSGQEAAACFARFRMVSPGVSRSFADAARLALASVLCSPEFIALAEAPRSDSSLPRALDGRELATRMALFLWRGLPDAALLQSAVSPGSLSGATLDEQVDRMMADGHLQRFIHDFDDGWLGMSLFDSQLVDPKMFPNSQGTHLRESLRREPDEFMSHLIASDASILDLLNSEYVVINQRLAEYYGMSTHGFTVTDDFRVVQAPVPPQIALSPWMLIGPFKAANAEEAYGTAYQPEQEIDYSKTYANGTLQWAPRPEWVDEVAHGLPGGDNVAWYLSRTVTAAKAQDIEMGIGSDDGCHLWMDGKLLLEQDEYRGVAPDQAMVRVFLSPGDHHLLLKINNGSFGSGFYFRLVGVHGTEFRRGGLLGMGAILMETSQSTRTSPVRRGAWVLQNLLGTRPPPPPPNAKDALTLVEASATPDMSRRQILEMHRTNMICASCHARFDPFGFALENYGPDGLWRTREQIAIHENGVFKGVEDGPMINPSGSLQDGRTFADVKGLKQLLITQPDPFVHAFARKLLAFAVGRRLGTYDDDSVDGIVAAATTAHYRIRAILKAVVASESFRNH